MQFGSLEIRSARVLLSCPSALKGLTGTSVRSAMRKVHAVTYEHSGDRYVACAVQRKPRLGGGGVAAVLGEAFRPSIVRASST